MQHPIAGPAAGQLEAQQVALAEFPVEPQAVLAVGHRLEEPEAQQAVQPVPDDPVHPAALRRAVPRCADAHLRDALAQASAAQVQPVAQAAGLVPVLLAGLHAGQVQPDAVQVPQVVQFAQRVLRPSEAQALPQA